MSAPSAHPTPEPGTALYVHLPFCEVKCTYCDFFSVEGAGEDTEATVRTILAEARLRAPRRPRTVFLGGGTPSYLPEHELRLLLDGLDELTGFRDSALEVTAECNPESLDERKARSLIELGVDRLSIGLQSLDPRTLELFGRPHDVADGFRAIDAARAAGARELSVDLIYAWPGQRPEAWSAELERVLAAGPDHFSAYNLTFERATPLSQQLAAGALEACPEELELELFQITREVGCSHGFRAYEISNYASKDMLCHHNVNYWRNGPYVGLGPSAASKVGLPPRRQPALGVEVGPQRDGG